ncbi:MAG: hypothetical protein M3068_12415 [Gemmatimonadota bacterium]|nr:hypothetical protein [Gemmatimonadota bacterium]
MPGQIIDVVADNYFFRAPATARAGLTTFRLRSPHGGHELRVIRLDSSHTVTDLVNALRAKTPTPWATELGGPAFPRVGGTANATMVLEPGRYALLCEVHDKDGFRHYQKGMFTQLSVGRGRRVPGRLPSPDIQVKMVEYAYHFSAPVIAGRHILRVTNAGSVYHEFKIVRVLPGFTAAQALAWKPGSGTPRPDVDFATLSSVGPGVSVLTTIDFPAGDYLIVCVPQIEHGMMQTLRVAPHVPEGRR